MVPVRKIYNICRVLRLPVTKKKTAAVTALLVLTVIAGGSFLAGAQMGENETGMDEGMSEDEMSQDENMTEMEMENETGMDEGMSDEEMGQDENTTEMDDEQTQDMNEDEMNGSMEENNQNQDTDDESMDDEDASEEGNGGESQPGFGVIAAVVALLAGLGYAAYNKK
jgi:PGF-CTERM protein